MTCRAAVEIEA